MSLSKDNSKYNTHKWEDSEFPILCSICLGDNPRLRMLKDKFGSACNVCDRPYTSYRWCPGKRMRMKNTIICQICAKLKNVCQTCLFDLDYGLPVQVRDQVLQVNKDLPKSDTNREYYRQVVESSMVDVSNNIDLVGGMVGKARRDNETLKKLARNVNSKSLYNRNLPNICSFWAKGKCTRGEECPYRHEMPQKATKSLQEKADSTGNYLYQITEDPNSQKNIRRRYYGEDDPLAINILENTEEIVIRNETKVSVPSDRSITTLLFAFPQRNIYFDTFNLGEANFYQHFIGFGKVRLVKLFKKVTFQKSVLDIGLVAFVNREDAESCYRRSNIDINAAFDFSRRYFFVSEKAENNESNRIKFLLFWAKRQCTSESLEKIQQLIPNEVILENNDKIAFTYAPNEEFADPYKNTQQLSINTNKNAAYPSQDPRRVGASIVNVNYDSDSETEPKPRPDPKLHRHL